HRHGQARFERESFVRTCHHSFQYWAHASGAAVARKAFLSNLPTDVLGTSSMKRTSSGSHHLATRLLRYSRISAAVRLPRCSARGTTYATGLSDQVGWARPITAASATLG